MFYRLCWFAAHALLPVFRTRWIGREKVPASGPVILAGNHVSYLDPVLIAAGMWRKLGFMAKAELFDKPVVGWVCRALTAFPVRRAAADREAIATATARLAEGRAVGIFPEGTRIREGEGVAQQGAAFIAVRSGAPIVPVGIDGTGRIRPDGVRLMRFPTVTIVYGEPIDPARFEGDRKERVQAITAELMRRIEASVEQARRSR